MEMQKNITTALADLDWLIQKQAAKAVLINPKLSFNDLCQEARVVVIECADSFDAKRAKTSGPKALRSFCLSCIWNRWRSMHRKIVSETNREWKYASLNQKHLSYDNSCSDDNEVALKLLNRLSPLSRCVLAIRLGNDNVSEIELCRMLRLTRWYIRCAVEEIRKEMEKLPVETRPSAYTKVVNGMRPQ